MKAHIVLQHYMKFALVCIIENNFQIQALGAYIRRAYYRRYFCVLDLGGLHAEGLTEGLIFGILRYAHIKFST